MIAPEIEERIEEEIVEIERREECTVLYACESGSRAWGFPSSDSDYDVRFVYVRPSEWYLRVDHEYQRDVIELPIDDELDISGWDLKKALLLLRKSNPALIEWFDSPIVYKEHGDFRKQFQEMIKSHYSPRACFYHYTHMAKGNYKEFLKRDEIRTKKYFYVLRPIFAMQWIAAKRGVVPMEFEELCLASLSEGPLRDRILELVEEKKKGFESHVGPRIDLISDFIEEQLDMLSERARDFDENRGSFDECNAFFLKTLNEVFENGS